MIYSLLVSFVYVEQGEKNCELCRTNSEPTELVPPGTVKGRQCFFNADEGPGIGKSVRCIKKERDQVHDFRSAETTLFKNMRWQVLDY